jgi:thioesterase domain-containing protein
MTDDFLEQATAVAHDLIPVLGRMGLRLVDLAPGRAAAEVPFEGNSNHIGTMYAGVLFSVAEMLGGVLAQVTFDGTAYAPIVKGADIRFLRPARTRVRASTSLSEDEIAQVTATADEHGKADYVLQTEVVDEEGTVVATLRGDYQLRKR